MLRIPFKWFELGLEWFESLSGGSNLDLNALSNGYNLHLNALNPFRMV